MTSLDQRIRTLLAGDTPIGHCPGCEGGDPCEVELGNAAARAVIATLDLHADTDSGDGTHCAQCGPREIWPCPTMRAIGEALGFGVGVDRDRP